MIRLIILLLLSTSLYSGKHPVYEHILKNRPNIDKQYAMKLSNTIHEMSVKYDVPKRLYTAILMQESGYKLDAKGSCSTGYTQNNETWQQIKICKDFGLSQISWKNIEVHNIDIDKLLTDMRYSVEWGAKILSGFKKGYSKRDPLWWTFYNCGNKGGTSNRKTCQRYKKKVERYL